MHDLRGKIQKSRKILMPSMHAAAVLGIFLSFSAGPKLFSATTWIGTDGVATNAANWSNGLPTTTNGAILNGTDGTVSSTLNFGNSAFSVLDLAVSNYSGDVTLNNLTDFRLSATTASLVANGVAGSTLTINNSATSTSSTVFTSANVWSGNMNVFLNRFVTHGTGARTLTTSIGQLTINDFYIGATATGGSQSINNSGTININTLSQRANSTLATAFMTTFAGGTVNLLGNNNSTVYSGIRLNGSTTLNLAGDESLGTADLYVQGGSGTRTYNLGLTSGSSSAVTLANNLIITNATATTVLNIAPGDGKSLALNGLISSPSASGGLVSFGAGTISIAGTNSYNTKSQIVDGGKLEVAKLSTTTGSALGTAGESTAANLTLDNGTLSYIGSGETNSRNFTIGVGGARIEANGTGLLRMNSTGTVATSGDGARTLTLAGANTANNSFYLKVADGAGGVTTVVKNGTGVWNIVGTGSTYSGGTEVRGGTLIAGSGDTSGFGTGEIRLYDGTTFKASGTTTRVFTNTFRTEGNINMDWVEAQSAVNLTSDTKIIAMGTNSAGASSVTFNGSIGGVGGLTKSGLGKMTLSASNSYSGPTSLLQGTLELSDEHSLPAGSALTLAANLKVTYAAAGPDLGNLLVTANAKIDFGIDNTAQIRFATATGWTAGTTLTITNSTGGGKLYILDSTGLDSAQIVSAENPTYVASVDANGLVTFTAPAPVGSTFISWLGSTPQTSDLLLQYAFGAASATQPLSKAYLPQASVTGGNLVLTYYVRQGTQGLEVEPELSTDLGAANGGFAPSDPISPTITIVGHETSDLGGVIVQRRTASVSIESGAAKKFLRVRVTQN